MASQNLTPASLNVSMTQGQAQYFQSTVVNDNAGAPVNLSAYVSLIAKAVANTPGPTTTDVTFGTVTAGATGIITLLVGVTDLATVTPGAAQLIISGKPTAGDPAQVLARGSITVQAG